MANAASRRELIQQFIPNSPLVGHLGIRLESIEPDRARLMLPFAPHVVTIGDVVHGGAIGALADTAVMAAAWASDDVPESAAGATVSLTLDFVSAARGVDLFADAEVTRRGRRLCFVRVSVSDPEGGVVASGLATYQLGA